MPLILVATNAGCRSFTDTDESRVELAGRQVWAMAPDRGGACLALVDGKEIWRRVAASDWSLVATSAMPLASIACIKGEIFGGSMAEAVMFRGTANRELERLTSFDKVPGRSEWMAQGPPLHVRALTATADGGAILAAVHVGGIPRSTDGGKSWAPTIPVSFDVHDVRAHSSSSVVAAAAAVGLCLSNDGGRTWEVFADGLELTDSLAVAVLHDQILFSIQEGPFADRSQIWRLRIGNRRLEQVREGLPHWLDGKVDTAHIAANADRAAIVDGGGNLWLSQASATGWERVARDLHGACGVLIV